MSEYQYYEWQTLDRPLTAEEQQAVNRLSSHISVSPTRAVVTYDWGDFKHDPIEVLVKYFDAHLYFANWGTRQLVFRFPRGGLDAESIAPYCFGEGISFETAGSCQVLEITQDDEGGDWDWVEPDGLLSGLARLRDDLLDGDLRALYLAWLGAVQIEYPANLVDELGFESPELAEMEPPAPPGLGQLTSPLKLFADFFGIDPFLIAAAAETSAKAAAPGAAELRRQLARLERAECDDFLLRLANGEPGVGAALRKRLRALGGDAVPAPAPARRTIGSLFRSAQSHKQAAIRHQAAEKRKNHEAEMKSLAAREPQAWQQVETLLQGRRIASTYDEATALLEKLCQLAEYQGVRPAFDNRLRALGERYNYPSLLTRWKRKGWL